MSFLLDIDEFVSAYRDYQMEQRIDDMGVDLECALSDDFNVYGLYPFGLDELSFLRYYMQDQGADDGVYEYYCSSFNNLCPSQLRTRLSNGMQFLLSTDLLIEAGREITMTSSFENDDIHFLAIRHLYPNRLLSIHDKIEIQHASKPLKQHYRVGSHYSRNLIELYSDIGIEHVNIPNPVDIGVRYWLKMGYAVSDHIWNDVRNSFIEMVESGAFEEIEQKKLLSLLKTRGKRVLNALARSESTLADRFFEEYQSFKKLGKGPVIQDGYWADLTCQSQQKKFSRFFKDRNMSAPRFCNDKKRRSFAKGRPLLAA